MTGRATASHTNATIFCGSCQTNNRTKTNMLHVFSTKWAPFFVSAKIYFFWQSAKKDKKIVLLHLNYLLHRRDVEKGYPTIVRTQETDDFRRVDVSLFLHCRRPKRTRHQPFRGTHTVPEPTPCPTAYIVPNWQKRPKWTPMLPSTDCLWWCFCMEPGSAATTTSTNCAWE